jgi:hypothetical protein
VKQRAEVDVMVEANPEAYGCQAEGNFTEVLIGYYVALPIHQRTRPTIFHLCLGPTVMDA